MKERGVSNDAYFRTIVRSVLLFPFSPPPYFLVAPLCRRLNSIPQVLFHILTSALLEEKEQ